MPQFSFTLGKAHKILERLSTAQGETAPRRGRRRFYGEEGVSAASGIVTVHVSAVAVDGEHFLAGLTRQASQALFTFAERLELQRDAAELKECIFAANQSSGASRIMMELSLQKAELAARTGARDAMTQTHLDVVPLGGINEDLVGRLRSVLGKPEVRDLTIALALFDGVELEGRLRALRVEINRLDDALRQANGSTTVTVELSEAGAALAGLM